LIQDYENFANNNNSEDDKEEAGRWNEYIEDDENYEETEDEDNIV